MPDSQRTTIKKAVDMADTHIDWLERHLATILSLYTAGANNYVELKMDIPDDYISVGECTSKMIEGLDIYREGIAFLREKV
jgi:hypothetical protein